MNEKKICLISDTIYDLNGVSRFIQDFAKESSTQSRNFFVVGSTYKKCDEIIPNIINIKPIFKIKMPFYKSLDLVLPNFFKIHATLKNNKPDLLHISTPGFIGLSGLISARILKIPVVGIYHTDFCAYAYNNTKSNLIEKIAKLYLSFFYRKFTKIFSRTNEYKKIIQKNHNFKDEQIITLQAGIDNNRFLNKNINKNYFENKSKFRFLFVGRISIEKNIPFLIDLFKKIKSENIELILIGDLELNIDIKELEKYNIFHLGRKIGTELLSIYSSCNVFIFPSNTDTLGQVVLEAMFSQLPVIVTNLGGPKEFVNDKFGYILDTNDESLLLEAINEIYSNKQLYNQKVQNIEKNLHNYTISSSFKDFWDKNIKIIEEQQ